MSPKTHGGSPQEEKTVLFVELGIITPNHCRHYQYFCNRQHSQTPLLLGTTHQPSFSSVSPPFELVEVPAPLASLLSLGGG